MVNDVPIISKEQKLSYLYFQKIYFKIRFSDLILVNRSDGKMRDLLIYLNIFIEFENKLDNRDVEYVLRLTYVPALIFSPELIP